MTARSRSPTVAPLRSLVQRLLFPSRAPRRGSVQSLLVYGGKGMVGLAATAVVFVAGFFRAGSRRHLDAFLGEIGIARDRLVAQLPSISVDDLPGSQYAVRIEEPLATDGNVSLLELLVISRLVAALRCELVFEIGTFDGRTTLNIAANTSGQVVTLDLPASDIESTDLPIDPSDAKYIEKPVSGARFLTRPERTRIVQVFGDSATFDFTPWYGRTDLVFIDGAHSKEYVLNDTDRALRLLKSMGGIILWHDYDAAFDGVTLALHEIANDAVPIKRVEGTSLAITIAGPETAGARWRTGLRDR